MQVGEVNARNVRVKFFYSIAMIVGCVLTVFGEFPMKSLSMLAILTVSLMMTSSLATKTVNAQIIELGDDVRVDLSNQRRRRSRTNVRVYGDNGRLTVGVEEQRRPQTRIRINDRNASPSLDIRQERPAPEERVRVSFPF